jgi:hypothetical protein
LSRIVCCLRQQKLCIISGFCEGSKVHCITFGETLAHVKYKQQLGKRKNFWDLLAFGISYSAQLAFLTPPFLGGFSAEVCEVSPHNSDYLLFSLRNDGQFALYVNAWLEYFENCFSHCFIGQHWLTRVKCHPKMADIRNRNRPKIKITQKIYL